VAQRSHAHFAAGPSSFSIGPKPRSKRRRLTNELHAVPGHVTNVPSIDQLDFVVCLPGIFKTPQHRALPRARLRGPRHHSGRKLPAPSPDATSATRSPAGKLTAPTGASIASVRVAGRPGKRSASCRKSCCRPDSRLCRRRTPRNQLPTYTASRTKCRRRRSKCCRHWSQPRPHHRCSRQRWSSSRRFRSSRSWTSHCSLRPGSRPRRHRRGHRHRHRHRRRRRRRRRRRHQASNRPESRQKCLRPHMLAERFAGSSLSEWRH
jgi:hypothetical protein